MSIVDAFNNIKLTGDVYYKFEVCRVIEKKAFSDPVEYGVILKNKNGYINLFDDQILDVKHSISDYTEGKVSHYECSRCGYVSCRCGLEKDQAIEPIHYKSNNGVEVIDIIEDFKLDFITGNVIKYVLRAGKKDNKLQDLKKAKWYLERLIDNENNNIDK